MYFLFGKGRCKFIACIVFARFFEYNVAIMFVVSVACGSDSHCVTWFIAYLCSVF